MVDLVSLYTPASAAPKESIKFLRQFCVVKDLFDKLWEKVTELRELGCHVVVGEVLPKAEEG